MKYAESILRGWKSLYRSIKKNREMSFCCSTQKKGFFHIIGFDDRLGRRKGFIIERITHKKTYAIHLILSFTGC